MNEHQESTEKEHYEAQNTKMEEIIHSIVSKLYFGKEGPGGAVGDEEGADDHDNFFLPVFTIQQMLPTYEAKKL